MRSLLLSLQGFWKALGYMLWHGYTTNMDKPTGALHNVHGLNNPFYNFLNFFHLFQLRRKKHPKGVKYTFKGGLTLLSGSILQVSFKTVKHIFIDRVRLKNQLAKILQVIIPSIFSPFLLRYPHQPWLTLK